MNQHDHLLFSEADEAQTVLNDVETRNWIRRQETPNHILIHVLRTRSLINDLSCDTYLQTKGLLTRCQQA